VSPFQSLSQDQSVERWISETLPWIHEAGNPYYDWFFGGAAEAGSVLAEWMRRPSSEVFVGRVRLLVDDGHTVGGFVALSGSELADCRRADAVATIQAVESEERGSALARMRSARGLFTSPSANEFYLSKMGVVPDLRGAGHGATIVRQYLDVGVALGFRRFRLDVWAGNRSAVHLYETVGFRVLRESSINQAGMTYLDMALEHDARGPTALVDRAPKSNENRHSTDLDGRVSQAL
jgi:ribosomal protein S18 acetylase RimI-like enzyme